jgi:hypothetical protein
MNIVRRSWRQEQPKLQAPIANENPVTMGLGFAYAPWQGFRTVDTSLLTPSGIGVGFDYASSRQTKYPHSLGAALTGPITLFVLTYVRAFTNYGALISKADTPDTNQPFELRCGGGATESQLIFVRARSAASKAYYATAGAITSGSNRSVFVTSPSSEINTTPTFFYGPFQSSLTSISGTAYAGSSGTGTCTDNGSSVYIGRRADGVTQLDGIVFFAAGWNRVLSANEINSMNRNPWQVFQPALATRFQSVFAAVTVPTLSASTYKPGTLTADGWQPRVTAS